MSTVTNQNLLYLVNDAIAGSLTWTVTMGTADATVRNLFTLPAYSGMFVTFTTEVDFGGVAPWIPILVTGGSTIAILHPATESATSDCYNSQTCSYFNNTGSSVTIYTAGAILQGSTTGSMTAYVYYSGVIYNQ